MISSPGGLPTLSLTTKGSWLLWGGMPSLSSVLWCQYPDYDEQDVAADKYATVYLLK